ncbi:hypothetical protein GAO04_19380 [Bacteroides uniformis]|uniref:Uncharacterized protein n=2 Tax=Bacteroidaceae TaxID=815 RepID=A0A6I0J3T4_BACUN|nr:hypothetical protein F3C88_25350 [Bacteroides ovatus]KAA5378972.1 hypothetical protein F2Y61_22385 [Phocaeicola dorei]KAA5471719.1 hypothetical protein F2Y37_00360 [Bacteroides caccae]KAB4100865.1 hypothetical protein GAQ70_21930 [Bacteroides uniformis]MBD9168945.1 hypothetical protein [Bacteroides thetaiotaomicron]
MWIYNNHFYNKLSELRKSNKLSSSKMRFLLKTNQIILIKHIERLPYELREATIQGIYSNEQQSDSEVRLC